MLSGWKQVLLGSRKVLRLAGEDTLKFLQVSTLELLSTSTNCNNLHYLYAKLLSEVAAQLCNHFLECGAGPHHKKC